MLIEVLRRSRRWRRATPALIALLTLILAIALPGTAQAKDKRDLRVMTQNLYVGSSLAPALGATSAAQFIGGVAQIYGTVLFTNYPARANAIADEISANRPDLIGLQEVTNWTAVGLTPGAVPPSFDFLAILQSALGDRGLHYDVAVVSSNASAGPIPLIAPSFGCSSVPPFNCLISLQDRDVILVNRDNPDLAIGNPQTGHYASQEILTTPVGQISFNRGWASIDGTLSGKKFRFATTHLETQDFPAIQQAQAAEFLAGPANAPGAVIAVGDFNSAADGSTTTSYADLTATYFVDSWNVNSADPGFSCCQNETLTNSTSLLNSRIDLVLTHGATRALDAPPPFLVGTAPFQAVPPLWESDHAGLVATLRLH